MLASVAATALLMLQGQALDRIVVTTAPPLDSERLADALRVYLGEFGITVEVAPADQTDDLRQRIANARHLGESVRAVAVIRAEPETPGEVGIELTDLATDKTLIASHAQGGARRGSLPDAGAQDPGDLASDALRGTRVARSPVSGRAIWSRRDRPRSPAGRCRSLTPAAARAALAAGRLRGSVALRAPGVVLQGAALTATYGLGARFDLSLGTSLLASTHLASGGVELSPACFRCCSVSARAGRNRRVELAVGPVAEVGVTSVTASPTTNAVPVRSARAATFFWRWAVRPSLSVRIGARLGLPARRRAGRSSTDRATTSRGCPSWICPGLSSR